MAKPLPVIVGVAQFNPRAAHVEPCPEPLEMMAAVSRQAAQDCGAPQILKSIDAVAVVSIISCSYQNAPGALANQLGIDSARLIYTSVGGNTPQFLVNHLCSEIAEGRIRTALMAGAEAMYSARRLMKDQRSLWGANTGSGSPTVIGDQRSGTNPLEERYGARLPIQIYPLFENARRAHHGWSLEEHRARIGELCASMSEVAAGNPFAWFRRARTAQEITTVDADNRMICFPYPKLMNAILDVDQAAALIITSEDEARRLGISPDKMIYVHSGADATERWFISERENYYSSKAMALAPNTALENAGFSVGDIQHFDFYSCFPAAVGLALDGLKLSLDDLRRVTVTGGLPYAGGPGNNYSTHAIAAMIEKLRQNPSDVGMVTALGWYMTKHAAGIYSAAPPTRGFARAESENFYSTVAAGPVIPIVDQAEGDATVETYTVIHDRSGEATQSIVIARLENGARFFANTAPEICPALEREEFVGKRGKVKVVNGLNQFEPL